MISPTLACADCLHLADDLREMDRAGVDFYHIDIMDGHFVPNLCLNLDTVKAIRSVSKTPMDVHLMVTNPMDYLDRLGESGVEYTAAHIGALDDPEGFIAAVEARGMKPGLVLSPEDDTDAVLPYLDRLGLVLVMGVRPGFSGQSFRPETLTKLHALSKVKRERDLSFLLEVDGGIGWDNIDACREAGADLAVAGVFAVFGQKMGLYEACVDFRKRTM